ncbi:MAG: rod shape-determining protein MreD [Bacteroidales bacterium]|nr:rod shape-determining protein MreD [Bacteroidales bacterium]
MNKSTTNILRILLMVGLQVLIFNHIHLFGFLNPNVYLLALFLLPLDIPKSAQYAIAFATGLFIDIFQFTYGIHASACMIFILLRPYLMYALNVNKKKNDTEVPIPGKKDFRWLLLFTLLMTLSHQLIVTMLEVFSFRQFHHTLLVIFANTLFTTLLILCMEYIFIPIKKQNL